LAFLAVGAILLVFILRKVKGEGKVLGL
jgi:hypothetical protein